MPKIHWIGIIEENKIREYQRGSLDSKAIKIKMPKNMNELMPAPRLITINFLTECP